MSSAIVDKLLDAVKDRYPNGRDPDLLRAEQLGVLTGLLAGLMYEYPGIKKDLDRITQYYITQRIDEAA
jgi:hypothetical protein